MLALRRSRRTAWLVLLAVLHLCLQPLASSAWCAVLDPGGDCCCTSVATDAEPGSSGSCCAQQTIGPERETSDDEEHEAPAPCNCTVGPELPPAAPQAAPQLHGLDVLVPLASASPRARTELAPRWRAERVRLPGAGPPRHLLLQVFRL